jgi:hypothetical protein
MDHLPVITKLNLDIPNTPTMAWLNYREVDWAQFCTVLEGKLAWLSAPTAISTQEKLDEACADITSAIKETTKLAVPTTTITANTKCWWTKELMSL